MTFHEYLRKLHPDFDDCPNPCAKSREVGKPTDLPNFCDVCEVRTQEKFFREAFERTIAEREIENEWMFETLYADVAQTMNLNARVRRGFPRNCSALQAACLSIVRREEYRPLRIARWQADQKPQSRD